jgi:hypothetical protein
MRWRCAAAIFHRSAVLSRRTSALLHLTICFPESDGAANHTSGNKNNQQFPPLTSKIPIQAVMEVVLAVCQVLAPFQPCLSADLTDPCAP